MDIAILNAIPFLLVLLLPLFNRLARPIRVYLLTGIIAALFGWLLLYLPILAEFNTIEYVFPWVPQLGLNLSFYVDGLSVIFGLIVTGIGAVVTLYTGYYFDDDEAQTTEFYRLLFLFMGSMLGVVMAGNVLTLFIAWELTSIVSFLLIGFKGNKDESARFGALQALVITGGGGLALLVGLLLLGTVAGSMEMSVILNASLTNHPWYAAIVILIMIGCFTKSAQFPFHFWLPGSMAAPSPASAYLHSATMVKAGIFLLFRLYPPLHETLLWQNTLIIIGLITFLLGAVFALRRRDLKALLAYSTVSQLGAIVALIGLPESIGQKAALVTIIGHALYKATMFLMTGVIEHSTGTRIIDQLGGLRRYMPGALLVVLGAALSMAGIPPLLGFVAKETFLDAFLEHGSSVVIQAVMVIGAALTVTAALIALWDVFFAKPKEEIHVHAPARELVMGPGLLSGAGLVFALALPIFIIPPLDIALTKEFSLYLFPPTFNQAALLSTIAIISGIVVFLARSLWLRAPLPKLAPTGTEIYQASVGAVEWSADQLLKTQGGRLRYYLVVILGSVALLMGTVSFGLTSEDVTIVLQGSSDLLKLLLVLLALAATLASIVFRRHLAAALALGITGYAIGGLFLLEPAPDVALVQFLVETLATVLIIVMLGRIDIERRQRAIDNLWVHSRTGMLRDIAISTVTGIGVALFALAAVVNRPERETIATWHLENAETQAGVPDVVAAILTDFRGIDTFFEIVVFSMAALGILTLFLIPRTSRPPAVPERRMRWWQQAPRGMQRQRSSTVANADAVGEAVEATAPTRPIRRLFMQTTRADMMPDVSDEEPGDTPRMSTPLINMAAMLVLPFALLISLSHVLYGGFAPGDGFTAGVVSGLGVTLWYVVFGYHEAKRRLSWLHPARLVGIGLALALANATLPLLLGDAFFHGIILPFTGPAEIKLSTATVFEVAIFLAVFGGTSVIMETIAYPREVEQL